MKAPQIVLVVLMILNIVTVAYVAGEPMPNKFSPLYTTIRTGLLCLILWWGGFFG